MHLFATALVAAATAASTPIIHTAAELHALPDEAFTQGTPFEIEGTVTVSLYELHFLMFDGTGGAYIKRLEGEPVKPGDVVRVRGLATKNRNRDRLLLGQETVLLRKTDPPEPIDATAEQILRGDCDWKLVRIKGLVRDAFPDEIDPRWNFVVLNCDSRIIYTAFFDPGIANDKLASLIDAVVSIKGACLPSTGGRRSFFGVHIKMSGYSDIALLEKAPADPFDAPMLHDIHQQTRPGAVFGMKRHRAVGSVVAAWGGNRFLMETEDGQFVRVDVAGNGKLPSYGEGVEAVGFPVTDFYRVNLSRALFRPAKAKLRRQTPQPVSPDEILKAPDGRTKIKTEYHGRVIRVRGLASNLPQPESGDGRMNLECGEYLVPVDASSCPESLQGLAKGTEMEITGTCIIDTDNWGPPVLFPRINGFLLVPRTPDDVKVLSRPPWWTPGRLIAVIGALLAALGGIAVWNRMLNRIVERRTRELMKERFARDSADLKVEERTRLAVELHDTLAQNLTGISLQIDAAQMAAEENPNSVMPYLETARSKMRNCRENLRNCLWDLRSRAFEEKNLAEAIHKTIAPHLGKAEVHVDMDVSCRKLSDNAIHAVLCIARELVTNAIRHGKATRIRIAGQLEASGLSFTVADDGVGFDPATRPGPTEGHFGLQGISERAHRLGGTFEIASKPNQGTTATLTHLSPEP